MRSELELSLAIERYADMVKRICMVNLKNYADTEDIFQTVFLKYTLSNVQFETKEHEKAWFIRVTINQCKDLLKNFVRKKTIPLDEVLDLPMEMKEDHREVFEAIVDLPGKYREIVYLHYYEGYTAPEIAKIMNKNVNTIYTNLTRARSMLRERLGGMADE